MADLPSTPAANGTEVLRVWAQQDGQLVVALTPSWDEPEAWGLVLADIARHVARAYHRSKGTAQHQTLEAILEMFAAEMANPTDKPEGGLVS
jgi:hypothetical protein